MKYQPPKCKCGNPLHIYEEEVKSFNIPICKNGSISKRKITTNWSDGAQSRLECGKCGKEYWIQEDEKGRCVRGEKWTDWADDDLSQ